MYFLGAVLLLAGAIWMTVNAAKKDGAVAAILCFICGFYTIYYGIKNFAFGLCINFKTVFPCGVNNGL